jgi:hypothetical protein
MVSHKLHDGNKQNGFCSSRKLSEADITGLWPESVESISNGVVSRVEWIINFKWSCFSSEVNSFDFKSVSGSVIGKKEQKNGRSSCTGMEVVWLRGTVANDWTNDTYSLVEQGRLSLQSSWVWFHNSRCLQRTQFVHSSFCFHSVGSLKEKGFPVSFQKTVYGIAIFFREFFIPICHFQNKNLTSSWLLGAKIRRHCFASVLLEFGDPKEAICTIVFQLCFSVSHGTKIKQQTKLLDYIMFSKDVLSGSARICWFCFCWMKTQSSLLLQLIRNSKVQHTHHHTACKEKNCSHTFSFHFLLSHKNSDCCWKNNLKGLIMCAHLCFIFK